MPWWVHGTSGQRIKTNCPFPAVSHGGWYYYDLRDDPAQTGSADRYDGGMVVAGSAYFYGNRRIIHTRRSIIR